MEKKNFHIAQVSELIKNAGITICEFEKIKEFIDFSLLDEDKTPAIIGDSNAIFIFDNEDYNQTYLIDLFIKVFNELKTEYPNANKLLETKIFYCFDFETRTKVFLPSVKFDYETLTDDKKESVERESLYPSFLVVDKDLNVINSYAETFVPFDEFFVKKILVNEFSIEIKPSNG
jgi:hypothetical protein